MLTLWAIATSVDLFLVVVMPDHHRWVTVGFALTALLGFYLGWKRRMATIFVAPLVSWFFSWFPLIIAFMIHFGVLRGFVFGIVWITAGWILIGGAQVLWLLMTAGVIRVFRGSGRAEPDVVIIDPPQS
jgi:hypothetical protein